MCGCASSQSGGAGQLEDVTWNLVEANGYPAQPAPADARTAHFRLGASDGRVTGFTGVNNFNGGYELSKQSLKFGNMAMTRRGGSPELMRQEAEFSNALTTAASWRSKGKGRIELLNSAGKPVASFAAAGP
jgi:heat shock protein HslJ